MYSKHESSAIRESFWTAFGVYMSLHHSSEGEKINWINYKTGIKHLYFKLVADKQEAKISIEINHPDAATRRKYFEQFLQSKKVFRQFVHEDWDWQTDLTDENGKPISSIRKILPNVNLYDKADWPAIISFFKPRLIALDEYWSFNKYGFENL